MCARTGSDSGSHSPVRSVVRMASVVDLAVVGDDGVVRSLGFRGFVVWLWQVGVRHPMLLWTGSVFGLRSLMQSMIRIFQITVRG